VRQHYQWITAVLLLVKFHNCATFVPIDFKKGTKTI